MTGGTTGKQIQLLIFDPVLLIAPGAVDLVIQVFVRLCQVGHHISRVGAMSAVLGLDDNSARSAPGMSTVVD